LFERKSSFQNKILILDYEKMYKTSKMESDKLPVTTLHACNLSYLRGEGLRFEASPGKKFMTPHLSH
jgi:hypothetical protein